MALIQPWTTCGRAAATNSPLLRAKDGVWYQKDCEQGIVPHTSIDTEAGWDKSGWHGWVYGWKLHLITTVAAVWIPVAAYLTPASVADNNEQFKGIFHGHSPVPTKGLINTRRFNLGAIFAYQLALLYRFEHGLDLCLGLKAFLKAA